MYKSETLLIVFLQSRCKKVMVQKNTQGSTVRLVPCSYYLKKMRVKELKKQLILLNYH